MDTQNHQNCMVSVHDTGKPNVKISVKDEGIANSWWDEIDSEVPDASLSNEYLPGMITL